MLALYLQIPTLCPGARSGPHFFVSDNLIGRSPDRLSTMTTGAGASVVFLVFLFFFAFSPFKSFQGNRAIFALQSIVREIRLFEKLPHLRVVCRALTELIPLSRNVFFFGFPLSEFFLGSVLVSRTFSIAAFSDLWTPVSSLLLPRASSRAEDAVFLIDQLLFFGPPDTSWLSSSLPGSRAYCLTSFKRGFVFLPSGMPAYRLRSLPHFQMISRIWRFFFLSSWPRSFFEIVRNLPKTFCFRHSSSLTPCSQVFDLRLLPKLGPWPLSPLALHKIVGFLPL